MMLFSKLAIQSVIVCFLIATSVEGSDKPPNEGDIRLMGSTDKWQGRVEIYHNKTWGTLCDDYWDINYAKVVCRQLNYPGALAVYMAAQFGPGKGIPIHFDRLKCYGNESKILDCQYKKWNHGYCAHDEDVGVSCLHQVKIPPGGCSFDQDWCGYTNANDDDFDWSRRAMKTPSWNTGPVHDHSSGNGSYIYIETSHPRVQGEMARVVSPAFTGARCIQFYYVMKGKTVNELSAYIDDGFQRKIIWQKKGQTLVWTKAQFPVSNVNSIRVVFEGLVGVSYTGDIAIDDVAPLPTSCSLTPEDAKPEIVILTNSSKYIRLVDGNVSSAGRIEVFHKGRWGTVCGTHFHLPAARVVCRQLGYLDVETIIPCCLFNSGKGMIWLDNLHCEGRERTITLCPHKGWGITGQQCSHNRDVGVICKTNSTLRDIRLSGSVEDFEGRVEVMIGGIWGTIMDWGFDIFDATVVCKQLTFKGASSIYNSAHYGMGKGPIWFSNAKCIGNESALWQCNMTQHQIQWAPSPWWHWKPHSRDASVECYDLRLAGGKSSKEGRLEIRYLGVWGTICNQQWNANAAKIACRNLGYAGYKALKVDYTLTKPASGIDPIWTSVSCKGDEFALGLCGYTPLIKVSHTCTHDNDVTLVCDGTIPVPTAGPKPCSSACPGTCYRTIKHGGVCICREELSPNALCHAIGIQISGARFNTLKYHDFNPDDFKSRLRDQLNVYCVPTKCPGVKNGSRFEIEDITILDGWPQTFHGHLNIRFLVMNPASQSREILPRSLITQMASDQNSKLAGYDVLMRRKRITPQPQKGNTTVKVVVPIVVVVVLLGLAVGVYIIYKRRSAFGAGGGSSANQRYLHLSPDDHHDQDDPLLSMEDDDEPAPTSVRA